MLNEEEMEKAKEAIEFNPDMTDFKIKIPNIPTDHQEIMNVVYYILNLQDYKGVKDRSLVMKNCGPIFQYAVQLGNFNYQVGNGGLEQWVRNNYAEEDLVDILSIITAYARKIEHKEIAYPDGLEQDDLLTCKNIINILNEMVRHADPTRGEWSIDCEYCDGSGEEESEEEEEIDCYHCGGSGSDSTKDYSRAMEFFDYQSVTNEYLTPASKKNDFYSWIDMFQRILNNFKILF